MKNKQTDGTFRMVPDWIIRDLQGQVSSIAAWCALHFFAMNKPTCWPSIKAMQRYVGLSEKTLRTQLKNLERIGAISIARRSGDNSEYTLHWNDPSAVKVTKAAEVSSVESTELAR